MNTQNNTTSTSGGTSGFISVLNIAAVSSFVIYMFMVG